VYTLKAVRRKVIGGKMSPTSTFCAMAFLAALIHDSNAFIATSALSGLARNEVRTRPVAVQMKVDLLQKVQTLKVLTAVSKAGLLSKVEMAGLLSKLEKEVIFQVEFPINL
jgi:hypothetical protein